VDVTIKHGEVNRSTFIRPRAYPSDFGESHGREEWATKRWCRVMPKLPSETSAALWSALFRRRLKTLLILDWMKEGITNGGKP
jgi:hypothetical protein